MRKTTLAQLMYHDNMIRKKFELKSWVYVSESFNVVGITKAILRSFHSSAEMVKTLIYSNINCSRD
jgi:hypothetical protein